MSHANRKTPELRALDASTNHGAAVSVGSGAWLGLLRFAPGQHENHVRLALVETCADLQKHVARWHGKRVAKDMEACCCWDHDSQGPDHGWVILAREKLTRAVVVHEMVHAGLLFVSQHVMASAAVRRMPEAKQGDYYDEACAQVVEKLYGQAEALLWPNVASQTAAPNASQLKP